MIVEIEDYNGNTIGAIRATENNTNGEVEVIEYEGDISIADIDFDDIFDTNEEQIKVQMDLQHLTIKKPIGVHRTGNVVGFHHKNKHVKGLMQELKSYEHLLESFNKEDYYNCSVLIYNYFGHIDYAYEFGYVKTHDEICYILNTNLCAELTNGHKTPFTNFVKRQIAKIKYNLENDYGIEDIDECFKQGEC